MRRRINRVIDELNTKLQIRINPFKLTRRRALIDRLVYDAEVMAAAEAYARENSLSREETMSKVKLYAREITPSFNAYAYFRVAYSLARRIVRSLYRVRLGHGDDDRLSQIDPESSVVFVMNHRSNMDYVIVAYLAATRSALSYAVGEWARIWPLQTLIKSLGAYFIRRGSGDSLYRKVLARYIQMATEGGVVQAIFPEGGLSLDGKLRKPKLGLIAYMVSTFDPGKGRDLVFIPVGVNYDRVIEDRSLVRRVSNEPAKPRSSFFIIRTTISFLWRNLCLMLCGRWYRLGYAGVNFGAPVSMREYCRDNGIDFRRLGDDEFRRQVERLGGELMDSIGCVIPVLPVSLVSTVLLESTDRSLSGLELKAAVINLMEELKTAGARVYIPRQDREYAVTVGLRMLTLRRIVTAQNGMYIAKPEELDMLRYYSNAIKKVSQKK